MNSLTRFWYCTSGPAQVLSVVEPAATALRITSTTSGVSAIQRSFCATMRSACIRLPLARATAMQKRVKPIPFGSVWTARTAAGTVPARTRLAAAGSTAPLTSTAREMLICSWRFSRTMCSSTALISPPSVSYSSVAAASSVSPASAALSMISCIRAAFWARVASNAEICSAIGFAIFDRASWALTTGVCFVAETPAGFFAETRTGFLPDAASLAVSIDLSAANAAASNDLLPS